MNAQEITRKEQELRTQLVALATEVKEKADIGLDRITQIEEEITTKSAELDDLEALKSRMRIDTRVTELEDRLKSFTMEQSRSKASAILNAVGQVNPATDSQALKSIGEYSADNFLKALVERKNGDPDAVEYVKAVLGTSSATGQALVPGNFVSSLVGAIALVNPYRQEFDVIDGVSGSGVDIPYEITAVTAALLQGAYGSNKEVRDWQFAKATATLYTIAQIADVGNQLLRQSNGSAEKSARRRLAGSIGMKEAIYITNGSGSGEPLGFFPALAQFGDVAAFKTTLSSEPRLAALARGFSAMEERGVMTEGLVVFMKPADYWELASETLGTSGSGGWALDPAEGAAGSPPPQRAWGVPVRRDPNWPAAKAGTALIIDKSEVEIFTGDEYRIDVSSEAGSRFDQNITGFRAEEEFGFNAEPYVRTGRVQQVIGL
jgi:HK97 family phage major capsid protein